MKDDMDFDRIAALACLTFSQEEKEDLMRDMESMLTFAATLSATNGEENEITDPTDVSLLREDLTSPCFERDALLSSAKTQREGYITVPRVWKEGEET